MAAEKYHIPQKTLYNKVKGKHPKKAGRPNTFTLEEETEICEILVRCSKIGVPLGKRTSIKIVKAIALAKGMDEAKFTDRWHQKFLCRNREISLRTLSALSFTKSREWTKRRCEEWNSLLQELGDEGFFDNPEEIWNLDESGFKLAELYDRVYSEKGVKEAVGCVKGTENDRENISLLAMGNAAGMMLRPLILYRGKMHTESHFRDTHDACYVGTNSSGVMDTDVLTEFLEKEFLSSIRCPKPLDKEVFGGVKQKWHSYLRDSRIDITIDVSGPMREGFRKTGIFPFDAELLRGTVNPNLEVLEEVEVGIDLHFADIARILREKIGLNDDKTTSCLLEIKKIVTGQSAGSVVALEFHKNLLRSAPQKKRREKDSRLDVSNGRILTERTYISTKKAAIAKNKEKAKGLRNRKRNIEAVEKRTTDSEEVSPIASQGYSCAPPAKRQRKTAKQVAAEIASDVPVPQPTRDSPVAGPEGYPSKTRAKRSKAPVRTTVAPRKKPTASTAKSNARSMLVSKKTLALSVVKLKAKKA
ncbi:hypothetical protein RvY_15291 [Ramazzottius varieornatus]|uniref:HTH CENPB-type domain-containing protein n=1 Tax=Ramazzottius varieornatus TaxID=947166 RepID=A0A1D1VUC4_RAMVA|nr:hypothetical protein RvY_15291 [Ramazzottius varieornatus]